MKTLSIIFIAIVLLTSAIGVTTVVAMNTATDKTSCTLDSSNIYKMVEATALDKEARQHAAAHDTEHVDAQSLGIKKSIVSDVVYN